MTPRELEALMVDWSREAGATALACFRTPADLVFKEGHRAVTEADRRIEARWRELLATIFPGDRVVGEEYGGPATSDLDPGDRVWRLDPIDGTLNFALGLPGFCTSMALMQDSQVLAACVHQPTTGDVFTALRGQGARLNGRPLAVSVRSPLSTAVVSAQLRQDGWLMTRPGLCRELYGRAMKVRQTGAIALELAWTAAGFLDALIAGFTDEIHLYDVAAGLLLVIEAGGEIIDFQGRPYQPEGSTLIAGNGAIQAELVALLAAYK